MRNVPAFVGAILLALFLPSPGSAYFLSGASLIVFGPIVAARATDGALWCLGAFLDAFRAPAGRTVARLAAIAALGSVIIAGAVSAGYAATLAREPGDVVYLPSLAIRADGRLSLAPDMTLAEAARAYAGPGEYWLSTCRATLPGWRSPVDWQGLDAIGRPLWRATISGAGVVEVSGLGPAETDSLRAFLAALAPIVAC